MSDKSKATLLDDYREAVRLYVWYSECPNAVLQAHKSKEQASRWLKVAHKAFAEYTELCKKE